MNTEDIAKPEETLVRVVPCDEFDSWSPSGYVLGWVGSGYGEIYPPEEGV